MITQLDIWVDNAPSSHFKTKPPVKIFGNEIDSDKFMNILDECFPRISSESVVMNTENQLESVNLEPEKTNFSVEQIKSMNHKKYEQILADLK